MQDSSFKDEFEADIDSNNKYGRGIVICVVAAACLIVFSGMLWFVVKDTSYVSDEIAVVSEPIIQGSDLNDNLSAPSSAVHSSGSSSTAGSAQIISATPSPMAINKHAFKARASLIVEQYSAIVGLVTFDAHISSAEKVARSKRATDLDRQYTNSIIELRGMVMGSDSVPAKYKESVELGEGAVAAISVGLTGLSGAIYDADSI